MRDVLEVIERLDAAVRGRRATRTLGEWHRMDGLVDEAWDEYWSIMEPLSESERALADPTGYEATVRWVAAERQAFYAQQTENIRAAWAARQGADA